MTEDGNQGRWHDSLLVLYRVESFFARRVIVDAYERVCLQMAVRFFFFANDWLLWLLFYVPLAEYVI